MKKWGMIAGGALVALVAVIVVVKMFGGSKPPPPPKVELPTGPDPAHLAKVAELFRQVDDYESKGRYNEALSALKELAGLEPKDPRIATARARIEEKRTRYESWKSAHQRAESERKDAARRNTPADWQKVVDACAEAEKFAPADEQRKLTREVMTSARQFLGWASAREEERKGNVAAALDLATQAIALVEPPAELVAYKTELERKRRKLEFERAVAAARAEVVPAKAYELWQRARPLAEDPKDQADVDAKINALKPFADPAERDRRYAEALKTGEAALKSGDFDAAEKAYREAQALKVTELAPGQALTKVALARKQKGFETAVAEGKAAEEKNQWSDAIDAYERALKLKPGDPTTVAHLRELEETRRPARIVLQLSEGSGVKMEFVLIKRGSFQMGDEKGGPDEKPRPVTIAKDFWIQTTELTQAQWSTVMNTKPWMSNSVPHMPVEGVTWEDTQKYFEKFNAALKEQLSGRRAALPTEAEWEYACRAGTQGRWYFGNDEGQVEANAWCARSAVKAPQVVGQKPANPWGLFDMYGNVAEWCQDPYAATSDPDAPQYKVIRGGHWNERPINCRSSKRDKDLPTSSSLFVGFRAVLR